MINNIKLNKSNFEELPKSCVIKNGTIVDTFKETEYLSDIKIVDGILTEINESIATDSNDLVIDAKGKYISAGFMDMHVHLREPGYEQAETFITGTNAAMSGGFTSIALMPNTSPCVDNIFVYNDICRRTENLLVKVHQIPAVTMGREGKSLVEMAELNDNGALAFSDDGDGIQSSEAMKGALQYAGMFNVPILVHEEDKTFLDGVMNESYVSTELGMSGIPNIAESSMIARDIEIARYVDGYPHFQHISTQESVKLIREAKKQGLKVSSEVTPHHFSLTDEKVKTFSTDYKMNPPLRTQEDVNEILKGLQDGTIDVIASDHAPHTPEKKNVEFDYAPFGVLGLETSFSVGIKYLVNTNVLSLMEYLKKITTNPRKILNLDNDLIKVGKVAELTIFDNNTEWKVDRRKLMSKSLNTCYHDEILSGQVQVVINNSKIYNR
ncbi:MAG: dihydroorotase [Candidatus Delongbacteria bacterium]|jgi:dihydroorotase|nr:dihydroorotase [Candidatus Delongbacteria bacterium]